MKRWFADKFELSRHGAGHNVRPMEGLRGLAVTLVFFVHYVALILPWISPSSSALDVIHALHMIGNSGVDLFFVLSGYLIYGSLIARPQPFVGFMRRRIKRIYPTFIAVFVIYLLLSYIFPTENKIPHETGAAAVYLLQNFLLLPGIFPIEPMITVAWSLSYEMFYYLTMPLLIGLFALRSKSSGFRVGFFITLSVLTVIALVNFGGPANLLMFVAGIMLFEVIKTKALPAPSSLIAGLALIVGLASTLIHYESEHNFIYRILILSISFFTVCLCCFIAPDAALPRAFSWTPLRWLGNMSYSYYLIHGLALKGAFLIFAKFVEKAEYGGVFFFALMPFMFIFSLIPSAILFLIIERPFSLAVNKEKQQIPTLDTINKAEA